MESPSRSNPRRFDEPRLRVGSPRQVAAHDEYKLNFDDVKPEISESSQDVELIGDTWPAPEPIKFKPQLPVDPRQDIGAAR